MLALCVVTTKKADLRYFVFEALRNNCTYLSGMFIDIGISGDWLNT